MIIHRQQQTILPASNRLYNLDYLRGLAALGIMVYHYLWAINGKFNAEAFLGRVGVYGVSIFYVLSGLTLYYVYRDKMKPSQQDVLNFFKKRFFRIFPLLWLVTFASIILSKKSPNILDLVLNVTGLFGFVKWDTYFSSGVWSIGNELVFYAFFPLFMFLSKSNRALLVATTLAFFGLFVYFSFILIPNEPTWRNCINPLNQVFLFLAGFLVGLYTSHRRINNNLLLTVLAIAFGVFVFYPTTGDQMLLQMGISRLVFSACCIAICLAFYKLSFRLPDFLHKPLITLGEISYSVYLLHLLVFEIAKYVQQNIVSIPSWAIFTVSLVLTMVVSFLSYHYFEKFFMRFGYSK
jgi:exopolysaccharide production protein ExoZ